MWTSFPPFVFMEMRKLILIAVIVVLSGVLPAWAAAVSCDVHACCRHQDARMQAPANPCCAVTRSAPAPAAVKDSATAVSSGNHVTPLARTASFVVPLSPTLAPDRSGVDPSPPPLHQRLSALSTLRI